MTVGPRHHWTLSGLDENGQRTALKGHGNRMMRGMKRGSVIEDIGSMRIQNDTWNRDEARILAKHSYGQTRARLQEDL